MKIATKSLGSLLAATANAVVAKSEAMRSSQLDRMIQRHDRKGELRASLLGIDPLEFREIQKKTGFDELLKEQGFRNRREFNTALLGKLKAELMSRGWTRKKIRRHVLVRANRMM